MTEQNDLLKRELEKKGFKQDLMSNVFSRTFKQSCPRDANTNEKQILYILVRDDDMVDFKVISSGRTGVSFEISVMDIPKDKCIHRITEIEGRFADVIPFFQ